MRGFTFDGLANGLNSYADGSSTEPNGLIWLSGALWILLVQVSGVSGRRAAQGTDCDDDRSPVGGRRAAGRFEHRRGLRRQQHVEVRTGFWSRGHGDTAGPEAGCGCRVLDNRWRPDEAHKRTSCFVAIAGPYSRGVPRAVADHRERQGPLPAPRSARAGARVVPAALYRDTSAQSRASRSDAHFRGGTGGRFTRPRSGAGCGSCLAGANSPSRRTLRGAAPPALSP